ncbi:aspartyl/asparaginyl beta-hydroxylase domain-containing protein [Shewanella waksmanii]|uniref:aspartyl/asparaginyl beta-hydroxylase domain-containing protein n=1 Tax=Shewanella waksmanii TaxID=213783 RepID=UPI00048D563A|nr:aspartyl/asparaginyl beta-hydroxylase domain-containing protein [Shewanella waksmanii]
MNITLPDRVKLPFEFDAKQLKQNLDLITSAQWTDHFVAEHYQGDWQAIALRCDANAQHPIKMIYSDPTSTEFKNTPYLQQAPYIQAVLNHFRCPILNVRLMKLAAQSNVLEHVDHDLDSEHGKARLHIPITTNANIDFRLNSHSVPMHAGECWYLRLSDPHSVSNASAEDRVHLVIDAEINLWLATQLKLQ